MSTFLTTQSLSVYHSASTPLFEDLCLTIQKGDRIGLIGHNGCGKSTLLKTLSGQTDLHSGSVTKARHCNIAYVEQQLPEALEQLSLVDALSDKVESTEIWRAQSLLSELGFSLADQELPISALSGGQHMRLLLARAIISEPDLLMLDEPSNHLDLPSLLWLENFLKQWRGSYLLVSHDQRLLDRVTSHTWIMRDKTVHNFALPCSLARQALFERDQTDLERHQSEQKEIDRIAKSAKRLAVWGKVYDNEDLARKAKTMQARKEKLESQQTELTTGTPWKLKLSGSAMSANRVIEVDQLDVKPAPDAPSLYTFDNMRVKSGDRVAILGANGSGKSTLLKLLFHDFNRECTSFFHPKCQLGYYDQSLSMVKDNQTLDEALTNFAQVDNDTRKLALISAGFEYSRHSQLVESLSGGERARLTFIGLTLARYHLLFLDEPTNHLDLEGKEELAETLQQFEGAAMIVSHDRDLIEKSCNRFWLIHDQAISEHHDLDFIYQSLSGTLSNDERETLSLRNDANSTNEVCLSNEDVILERLLELEQKLVDDLARKPKFQKPKLQAEWQAEIDQLSIQLNS